MDSQDNIWVGHVVGVTRIDGKSGNYSFFRTAGSAPANLSNTFVTAIVKDHSGYLWFGTYGGGLNRYDPRTGRFVAFRHSPGDPHSLSHDIVYSLMVDRHGTLWTGTVDGLNRLEDPVTGRFRSWKADRSSASSQDVPAIIEDPNGMLWLVSQTLQRFDPATERFTAYRFDFSGTGRVDQQSSATLVAVATKTVNNFLSIDHSGVLWLGTPNGLLRFDRDREQFVMYGEREGLSASSVLGILEDRDGNLWVGTDGGLSRFNPSTKTFTNYYQNDGLASHAFEGSPAAFRSRRGQMFFGSTSGLTSFWPDQIVESRTIPPVVLTEFSLRNVPVSPAPGSVLAKSITYTPSLTLSHDQNMFSFEFAALSYVDPQRNQYRYMLEPLDRSWNPVDPQRRIATFTTLPAGQYTLRVQGSNNRGAWNEDGVTLLLEILPPWWGTTWFRGASAGVFVALLWAGYRLRLRQLHYQYDMTLEARVGSGHESPGSCTTRCCKASTVCCCDSRRRPTCCRSARQTRNRNWMVRLNTLRRRSLKAVTRCKACDRRPSKATISRWRSRPSATSSRPERVSTPRLRCMLESKATRENCARSFVTRSTRLRRKPCGTASGTPRPGGSKSRFVTTAMSSDCE